METIDLHPAQTMKVQWFMRQGVLSQSFPGFSRRFAERVEELQEEVQIIIAFGPRSQASPKSIRQYLYTLS